MTQGEQSRTLKITEIVSEADSLNSVRCAFSGTPFSYTAGQYVKLSAPRGEESGTFALASSPEDKDRLEFLVRDQERGFAHAFFRMRKGDSIEATAPMGKGFPLSSLEGKQVVFMACGSGISPIASCMRTMVRHPMRCESVSLFYGARTPDDFAYAKETDAWADWGAHIFKVVSRPNGTGWTGLTGHIQEHLKDRVPGGKDSTACLVGMKGMIEEAARILKEMGVPKKNILLNY